MHFDAEKFFELGPAERLAALRALAGATVDAPVIPSTNCPRWLATIADDMTRGLRVHAEHVPVWMDVGPDGLEMGRCRMVVGQRVCVGYSGLGEDEQAAFRWALSQTAEVILMGRSRNLYVDGVPYRFRKDWPAPDRPALKALGVLTASPEAPEAPADRTSAGADGVAAQPGESVEPQRHRDTEVADPPTGGHRGEGLK